MPNRPQGRIFPEYRGKWFQADRQDGVKVLRSWLYARPDGGAITTILNNASFLATAAINLEARDQRFDVMIASSPPFFPHMGGVLHRALNGTPLILELRDLWPDYAIEMGLVRNRTAQRGLLGLERWMIRGADHLVAVTDSFRRRLVAKGVSNDRISVVPNGVDLGFYRSVDDPAPVSALEQDGEFRVGYLGNMGRGQDLTTLVDAAALLQVRRIRCRLVLAGDGPERHRIVAAIAAARLANIVVYPVIPKALSRAFYNTCDVCLVPLASLPVFQETIPSKLFEIMACERPVIGGVDGEARSIIESSGAGVAIPPGDAESLACAIEAMMNLPASARAAMGQHGRAWVSTHVDRDQLAATYLKVLRRVATMNGEP
jgi:glycosyltransferase involved in cell wall biosynthesis